MPFAYDKNLYCQLHDNKDDIEKDLNLELDWRELPTKKASRIIIVRTAKLQDQNEWTKQFDWIVDIVLKFRSTFKKYI